MLSKKTLRPLARTDGLLSEEVDGELLVYDEDNVVACRLNGSAALVWRSCDGKRSVADLVAVLTEEVGELADEDLVMVALDTLADHDLIESGYQRRDAEASRFSRRRFIRRVGIAGAASIAVPVVAGMVPPVAAAATSGTYPYYIFLTARHQHS
ncbi:MAG TPA: PqqD family protein [Solirubrobacteraceae bacterium]